MLKKILTKILGDPNEKILRRLWPIVHRVNEIEKEYQKALKDEDFPIKTHAFKKRLEAGETLDQLLPEAFALVKNACRRLVGVNYQVRGREMKWDMVPFDVQILGGVVLHEGKISEMKTGEGKTLVCTMPVYLNALAGKGVHVVTVNDYLAQRDAEWMGLLYSFLGMNVGVIIHGQDTQTKKEAYNADITYGTNNEFGFDYLRDNMATDPNEMVERELFYAIVDEVDSILVDEARTPLIISSPAEESTEKYVRYSRLIPQLANGEDYVIDEKLKAATLTEAGIAKMEKWLGVENIYTERGFEEVHHIEQALKSHTLFKKDVDYVVKDDEVIIVDEFTGRLMPGRRYSDGLHQAIEAKEKVEVKRESRTLATISFQNYFRIYKKLAGMTGTAATEAEEFLKIYGLEVVMIPTHRNMVRNDHPDAVFKNERGKFKAATDRIEELYKKGQPVLVGTISIEKSERLSQLLKIRGVPHSVLNAKYHEKEAEIVAQAGQKSMVTIATNMAGRGTDIKLGSGVTEVGGLFILGTERHEARRIDNQLRGRSGRQGDHGESQFLISMEDDLMRLFGSERIQKMMEFLKVPEDMPIENKMISNSIESAQMKVEGRNFDIRKHLVEYDDVMNKHREIMYKKRRQILFSGNIENEILLLIEKEAEAIAANHIANRKREEWDISKVVEVINALYQNPEKSFTVSDLEASNENEMIDRIKHYLWSGYKAREKSMPDYNKETKSSPTMRQIEQAVYLRTIDSLWMEHIDNMAHLREGVALYGYGQKDPLVEYKREAFLMFQDLLSNIRTNTVNNLFKMNFVFEGEAPSIPAQRERPQHLVTNEDQIERVLSGEHELEENSENPMVVRVGGTAIKQAPVAAAQGFTAGRNDPCPCGSGKKFKKCHGK